MHLSIRTDRVGTGSIRRSHAPRRRRPLQRPWLGSPASSPIRLSAPGERTVASITLFREAEQAESSNELAAQWIAEELQDFKIESMGRFGGELMVNSAIAEMLEPAHR
jgi:hypothetical protein